VSRNGNEELLLGTYRVLELADEKGVYCGKLLADMGADVVKVEPPGGDRTRFRGPFYQDEADREKSLYFLHFNTDKRSITLDIEQEAGQAVFRDLVKTADALIETYPPGHLKRLGLDYESLREINPRLVMCSITPFGQTGPHSRFKATDLVNMAVGFHSYQTGEPSRAPLRWGGEQSYHIASQYAAVGTMYALYHRAATGEGQHIDISIQECLYPITGELAVPHTWYLEHMDVTRMGARSLTRVPNGIFPCRDGQVAITILEGTHWDALAQWIYEATGEKEVLDDMYKGRFAERAPYRDIVEHFVIQFFMRFTALELMTQGQRRGIPIFAVQNAQELVSCPQLAALGFFVEAEHPVVGKLKYPGAPYRISEAPWRLRRAAPRLGEHNEEIYKGDLGYSEDKVIALRKVGTI